MNRKKISTTVYVEPEQDEKLKELSRVTHVPVAEFIRQGIDLILARHRDKLGPDHLDIFDSFRGRS